MAFQRHDSSQKQAFEKLISINRVAKVHKGGKRLSFDALGIVGDGKGKVGMALGKAGEAAEAIRKAFARAQRNMVTISIKNGTIPHETIGRADASKVLLKPASPGTGIIAGGPVRAICEACGIRDILTKSLGSPNALNLTKATLNGLLSLHTAEEFQRRRRILVDVAPTPGASA
jgi:small subunit ribosomal protein S5